MRIIVVALIIAIIITSIALASLFFLKTNTPEKDSEKIKIQVTPLSQDEKEKVKEVVESSEFIKEMPESGITSLRFFSFSEGNKTWQDEFLIGKGKIVNSGTPDIYLTLDSKYISQLNNNNLCEIIKNAKENGDLGFYSESNKALLLVKYAGMLKYKDCFGL